MNPSTKNKERTPLLVMEVVLPDEKKPEIRKCYFKESSGLASNHLINGMKEHTGNTVNSFGKIGNHEVRPLGELYILEKKPLENYFGGTLGKKQIKRKNKYKRETQSLRALDCTELQTELNGEEVPHVNEQPFKEEEFVAEDEKIERNKLLLKIDKFEKMLEYKYQNSYRRQRLAEEKYIQQQEDLAETWWEFLKRRNQLKQLNSDDILTYRKPFCTETSKNYDRFCISIISRKFWNDDRDKFSKKPEKDNEEQKERISMPTSNQSGLDNLEGTFFEKLVFVDDEDMDNCDYKHGNFQPTKNLN